MKMNQSKFIRRVSVRNLKMTRTRSLISIVAIALTTLLFTSLFTILLTMSKGFEESNFRQVGTYAHGEFKNLTRTQFDELCTDPDITAYGVRRILGMAADERLYNHYTEISFMDKNTAKWSYCKPEKGHLPKENTNEAATDTRVLSCLGIKPEIGQTFSLAMDIDGVIVTEEFVLSGYWEYDEAAPASHLLLPESRYEAILSVQDSQYEEAYLGAYGLNVMLKRDYNIEDQLIAILERHGCMNGSDGENAIAIGSNWGYMGANLTDSLDAESMITLAVILLFIMLTGYLIIYNIFRIAVANEIRHYGMLKTIGTTQSQIKTMVLTQGLVLSAVGIPLGLLCGWLTGSVLCPVVLEEANVSETSASVSPWIFVFSAVFALITVLISCFLPARAAARVTPVEALRYTEQAVGFSRRSGKKGVSLFGMARARLTGSKGRTVLVIASLSLSIVTFTLTSILAGSFNMEKYLADIKTDFIVAEPEYFTYDWDETNAIHTEEHAFLREMDGVTNSFVTYGISMTYNPDAYLSETIVRSVMTEWGNDEYVINDYFTNHRRDDGTVPFSVQVLGMEENALSKIKVFEGDITKIAGEGFIAVERNEIFSLGDKVTIRYTDLHEYVNTRTGEVYADASEIENMPISEWQYLEVNEQSHDVVYEIAAIVDIPSELGYRFSTGAGLFLTSDADLIAQSGYTAPIYIALDTTDEAEAEMETFIADYTDRMTLDYTSRVKEAAAFASFQRMFMILGAALSIIVGLIGVLNFINTMMTSIHARQREIAALQAIGMTGRQLCTTLIWEGMIYVGGTAVTALVLNLITIPLGSVVEKLFWFCDYNFSILPLAASIPVFAAVGVLVPLITYRLCIRRSIVERLRECE
ncbi:MAG: ABC transporter permease [Ruminococcus sp.]|nr:ABC transporter permease [Ruminococcus sp.]